MRFLLFWSGAKNPDFLVPLQWPKKSENWPKKRPGGPFSTAAVVEGPIFWDLGPGAARARPCTKVQKQETRLKGLKAIGKQESCFFSFEKEKIQF